MPLRFAFASIKALEKELHTQQQQIGLGIMLSLAWKLEVNYWLTYQPRFPFCGQTLLHRLIMILTSMK